MAVFELIPVFMFYIVNSCVVLLSKLNVFVDVSCISSMIKPNERIWTPANDVPLPKSSVYDLPTVRFTTPINVLSRFEPALIVFVPHISDIESVIFHNANWQLYDKPLYTLKYEYTRYVPDLDTWKYDVVVLFGLCVSEIDPCCLMSRYGSDVGCIHKYPVVDWMLNAPPMLNNHWIDNIDGVDVGGFI